MLCRFFFVGWLVHRVSIFFLGRRGGAWLPLVALGCPWLRLVAAAALGPAKKLIGFSPLERLRKTPHTSEQADQRDMTTTTTSNPSHSSSVRMLERIRASVPDDQEKTQVVSVDKPLTRSQVKIKQDKEKERDDAITHLVTRIQEDAEFAKSLINKLRVASGAAEEFRAQRDALKKDNDLWLDVCLDLQTWIDWTNRGEMA